MENTPNDDQLRSELIEKHRDINVDYEWWDCLYDDFKVEMLEKGISVDQMYFTGFYSQGDGACFTGQIDMKVFLKMHDLEQEFMGATFFAGLGELYANIEKHNHHYSHENTAYIDLQEDTYNNYDVGDLRGEVYSQMFTILDEEWARLDEVVTDICRGYMQNLYSKLRDEYEYLTSKEVVWETIVANDLHVVEAV